MSYTYQRQPRIYVGDSVDLQAFLYVDDEYEDNEVLVPQDQISDAYFSVKFPTDTDTDPLHVFGADVPGDGEAKATIPGDFNSVANQYHATCTFIYGDSAPWNQKTRTVLVNYDVVDPFQRTGSTPADPAVDGAWDRLSDLFDSEDGGPWLRDMTMGRFDKTRIRQFVPDVLFDINNAMPATDFSVDSYPYKIHDAQSVMIQGLVVRSIMHFIRSYTEQPDVMNSPAAFLDRKRYLDAWSSVYNLELARYEKMVEIFKRRYFAGGNKMLIGSKAGRGFYGPWRTRGIWPRGY